MITDAHIHFWDPERLHYDWLRPIPELRRRFTPELLRDNRHAVGQYVFVQADCRADEAWAEIAWVSELAQRHPIAGIVAYAGVHEGAAVRPQLERLAAHERVVGVRRLLQGESPSLLNSDALAAGIGMLAEYGLTFDACVTHEQLPAVTALAARCPHVRIVLDHLGKPDVAARRLDPWRGDLAKLAEHSNVVCKLSGLATEADRRGWTADDLHPYLDHALASFGPERCLVGSDWPVATLATSYDRWFDVLLERLDGLSEPERTAVLSGTAERVYGLTPARPGAAARSP
jgi:L-fuconolactonase